MTRPLPDYHRMKSATNRGLILDAAAELFLESGYDRTSLARVAERAGVSSATLFKQFPTKAELFEATVLYVGTPSAAAPLDAPSGDFPVGLTALGTRYAELLDSPRMTGLIRTIIAESSRFPELRARTFDFGTLPVLIALRGYLTEARASGAAEIDDVEVVATQFLGMISNAVFWPALLHGTWSITPDERRRAVDEAVRTIAARCRA